MSNDGKVVFFEDFKDGMDNWWVEGGVKVWVMNDRLHMDGDPGGARSDHRPGYGCTVWCKEKFEGDLKIEYDAHVLYSGPEVNNINFFFYYSDPDGTPMIDKAEKRHALEGDYRQYHDLNGHIITFLQANRDEDMAKPPEERPARVRMRRCPGFELMNETYAYECQANKTYHCQIIKRGKHIEFSVDGNVLLEAEDDREPLTEGLIGLRTFRTYLWWDNIRVTKLD
ncbi:MAG: DUF1961 family protein [Armatimonadota bacterium]